MLNFFSGHSKAVNPKKATKEAMSNAMRNTTEDITLVILNSSSGYNHLQILETLKEIVPNAKIIGATGCGVISHDFVNETLRSLALTAVTGDEFCISKITNVEPKTSYELSKKCAKDLKSQNENINMIMVFAPGIRSNGEEIINGFNDVFTDEVPILGGLAGFNGKETSTILLCFNQEIMADGIVVVGFYDKTLSCVQASHHGYLTDNNEFSITKIDGQFIVELDNKPAWYAIMDSYDLPHSITPLESLSILALGKKLDDKTSKEYDNTHTLTAPLFITKDGAVLMQTNIALGDKIAICLKDEDYLMSGIDNLNSRIVKQYSNKKPVAVFQTDCVARGRLSNGVTDKEEIIKNLQNGVIADEDVSWMGIYAVGEFAKLNGKNHYHNYTTTISVLLR